MVRDKLDRLRELRLKAIDDLAIIKSMYEDEPQFHDVYLPGAISLLAQVQSAMNESIWEANKDTVTAERIQSVRDILFDHDGCRTVKDLKELIDEAREALGNIQAGKEPFGVRKAPVGVSKCEEHR